MRRTARGSGDGVALLYEPVDFMEGTRPSLPGLGMLVTEARGSDLEEGHHEG